MLLPGRKNNKKKCVCVDKEKELKPFERVKEMHEKAFRTY